MWKFCCSYSKIKSLFFLVRLLNYSNNSTAPMGDSHRHHQQCTVFQHQHHHFAYAIQPGILCIKYKSRLAVLIKEKNLWKRKSFPCALVVWRWCTLISVKLIVKSRLENRGKKYKWMLNVLTAAAAATAATATTTTSHRTSYMLMVHSMIVRSA